MSPALGKIGDFLPLPKLMVLRNAYSRQQATALLTSVLPTVYDKSREYNDAIAHAFYGVLPSDCGGSGYRDQLSVEDRERCLIALLCSRDDADDLAIHIYLGLMEGLTPEEIANIIMLTGMYAGVDRFTSGLFTEATTLGALAKMVDAPNADLRAPTVIPALAALFRPTPKAPGT